MNLTVYGDLGQRNQNIILGAIFEPGAAADNDLLCLNFIHSKTSSKNIWTSIMCICISQPCINSAIIFH